MNRQSQEQRQEVFSQKERLHGEHEVQEQRRVRHAPPHRRPGGPDEEDIGCDSCIPRAHGLAPTLYVS